MVQLRNPCALFVRGFPRRYCDQDALLGGIICPAGNHRPPVASWSRRMMECIAEAACDRLTDAGYEVVARPESPPPGLAPLTLRPDLVLMDVGLKGDMMSIPRIRAHQPTNARARGLSHGVIRIRKPSSAPEVGIGLRLRLLRNRFPHQHFHCGDRGRSRTVRRPRCLQAQPGHLRDHTWQHFGRRDCGGHPRERPIL